MKTLNILAAALFALALSGCASIISGTTQTIAVDSNPPGADCQFVREGVVIGSVKTPAGMVVQKTKDDISVKCQKEGYQEATGYLPSDVEGATFGNIVLGGVIGWGIDSASGADNKYPEHITITLVPVAGQATASSLTPVASLSGATRWVGRGPRDACGLPWELDLTADAKQIYGTMRRGKVIYDVHGRMDATASLADGRAGRSQKSNGQLGPAFLTLSIAFTAEKALGEFAIEDSEQSCKTPISLVPVGT